MNWRRLLWLPVIVILLVVIVGWVIPLFHPWSEFNCRHQDIDIQTGRQRFTRYLFYCKISERVVDSPLTEVLPVETIEKAVPDWHRVNTFSPGHLRHSPHHGYHAAFYQIRKLQLIWEMGELSPDLKQRTAQDVLALWQQVNRDNQARRYLSELGSLSMKSAGDSPDFLRELSALEDKMIEKKDTEE